jgi:hypothetical protein
MHFEAIWQTSGLEKDGKQEQQSQKKERKKEQRS